MKRQYPDNNRGPQGGPGGPGGGGTKRYRADAYNEALAEGKFELRMLIPTKAAGAVIGKGGEYIKSVREKFDATLTVPDRSTPERVLTILCRQEVLIDCFNEVLLKLAEEEKRGELELRVLVHQSHAGAIIGRGGSKIKELREATQSHLKVFQECCPNSTDRVLLISATQAQLPETIRIVVDFMREIPIKGVLKPYDAVNYDPRMTYGYGGIEDKRFGGPMGGGRGRGPPGMMPPPFEPQFGRGPPMGYGASSGGGYGGGGYGGGRGGGGPPPMGMGGMSGPPGGFMDAGGAVTSTQVTIPNELGGTIIGKGGERINRIRQESGARIEVGQSSFGADERVITITGTPHQIQSAQYLLQQSVRASEAGRRYLQEQR